MGQKCRFLALPGGFLEDRIWVLWNFCPIFGHLTLFRWLKLQILTLMVYPPPHDMTIMTDYMIKEPYFCIAQTIDVYHDT